MSLLNLPNELLLQIAEYLQGPTPLSSFLLVNRRLTELLTPLLHKFAVQDKDGKNALLWAAHHGYECLAKLLLEKGFDVDFRAPPGFDAQHTALHCAVLSGRGTMVRMLLENGASVKMEGSAGDRALHIAAFRCGDGKIVRMLLDMGADHEALDKTGKTALHIAALHKVKATVKVLLEKGASVNKPDKAGMRPLHLAISGEKAASYAVVNMLIENGADVSARDLVGQSALYLAVRKGYGDVVKLILAHGGGTRDSRSGPYATRQSALQVAAFFGYEGIVRQLLEKGESDDLTCRDYDGYTALDYAAISACRHNRHNTDHNDDGGRAIVNLLLEKQGVNLYTLTTINNVLLWAAEKGHKDILNLVLESGADISSQHHSIPWVRSDGRVGDTALHAAAEYGQAAIVRVLLEKGANFKVRNRLGFTPLDLALRSRNKVRDLAAKEEVVRVLRDKVLCPSISLENTSRIMY